MKLKICGIQNIKSAQICEDLDIDFIGLNFVPISKRFIGLNSEDFNKCNNIAKVFKNPKVGVFMNQDLEIILNVLENFSLDIIQLHGDESPEFIKNLKEELKNLENKKSKKINNNKILIWKAFSLQENFDFNTLQQYCKVIDLFLFDGFSAGSGEKIKDQKILQKAIKFCEENKIKYGIAGGINNQNIQDFKKNFPKAFLLDTASGIEKNKKFNEEVLKKLVKNFKNLKI